MDKALEKLRELWPIIAFILGLTFAVAQADTTQHELEVRVTKLETAPERLARIEGKLDTIQDEIKELKQ